MIMIAYKIIQNGPTVAWIIIYSLPPDLDLREKASPKYSNPNYQHILKIILNYLTY